MVNMHRKVELARMYTSIEHSSMDRRPFNLANPSVNNARFLAKIKCFSIVYPCSLQTEPHYQDCYSTFFFSSMSPYFTIASILDIHVRLHAFQIS